MILYITNRGFPTFSVCLLKFLVLPTAPSVKLSPGCAGRTYLDWCTSLDRRTGPTSACRSSTEFAASRCMWVATWSDVNETFLLGSKALQHPEVTHVLLVECRMLWLDLRLFAGPVGQSPRSAGRFHRVCWSGRLRQDHNSPRCGSKHVQGAAGVLICLIAFGVWSPKLASVVGKILNEWYWTFEFCTCIFL